MSLLLLYTVFTFQPDAQVLQKFGADATDAKEDIDADKCIVEVEITSSPQLAKEFGIRRYELEVKHEREDILLCTELSIPDKEGSQT